MHIKFISPLLNQLKYLLQVIPRKITDLDVDALEQDINTDLKKIPHIQEGVISETYQRPNKPYFQEPPELQVLVSTGKLVKRFYQTRLI